MTETRTPVATTGPTPAPATTPAPAPVAPGAGPSDEGTPRYQAPGWFTRHVFNGAVRGLTRLGISVLGSRVLEHRGRRSGELHRTPVNLLQLDEEDFLVAARGETQWVRNVRADGGRLVLGLGRRRTAYVATELADDDPEKTVVLRAYLRRFKVEVGVFFGGVDADAPDEEFAAEAVEHPAFRLTEVP